MDIKDKFSINGLEKLRLRPFSASDVDNGACPWSSVRYEPDEESAARRLKSIVEKIAPNQEWSLLALDLGRPQGKTPGYISVFLEDIETFNTFYASDDPDGIDWEKSRCEEVRIR